MPWTTDVINAIEAEWPESRPVEEVNPTPECSGVIILNIEPINGVASDAPGQKARAVREFLETKGIQPDFCDVIDDQTKIRVRRRNQEEHRPVVADQVEQDAGNGYIGSKQAEVQQGSIWDQIKDAISKIEQGEDPDPLSPDYDRSVAGFPLNVIFSGPPGTGKTWAAKELLKMIEAENQDMVCFHPAMAYEDFVRALASDGAGAFKAENKVFGEICDKALATPDKLFAILIDEINRANLPAVLGQLMTALEYRYRDPRDAVTVPHKVADPSGKNLRDSCKLVVPQNLLVIGTMNTADRSTGLLDYALRRRFIFFQFKPILTKAHKDEDKDATELFKRVLGLFYKDSDNLTGRSEILAPEFEPDDVAIGHSYFMGGDWKFKAKHQVAPLLKEYLRDGVLKEHNNVTKAIEDLRKL